MEPFDNGETMINNIIVWQCVWRVCYISWVMSVCFTFGIDALCSEFGENLNNDLQTIVKSLLSIEYSRSNIFYGVEYSNSEFTIRDIPTKNI